MDFRNPVVVTYYYTDAYVGKAREYMEKFSVKKTVYNSGDGSCHHYSGICKFIGNDNGSSA